MLHQRGGPVAGFLCGWTWHGVRHPPEHSSNRPHRVYKATYCSSPPSVPAILLIENPPGYLLAVEHKLPRGSHTEMRQASREVALPDRPCRTSEHFRYFADR